MKSPIQVSVPRVVRKLFFPALVLAICSVGLAQNGLNERLDDGLGSSRAPRLIKITPLAEEKSAEATLSAASPAGSASVRQVGGTAVTVLREGVSSGTCYLSPSSVVRTGFKSLLCADEVWQQ